MQLPLHPRVQAVAGVLVLVLNLAGHLGLAVPPPPVVVVVVVVVLVEDHGHAELVVELLVAAAVVDLEVGNALAFERRGEVGGGQGLNEGHRQHPSQRCSCL
eukprot:scaffold23547_cov129-Isochrysis_galbana.AAC.1